MQRGPAEGNSKTVLQRQLVTPPILANVKKEKNKRARQGHSIVRHTRQLD
jgi:hypothetical protein